MLDEKELKKLFHGQLRFETKDGYLRAKRFTKEQIEYLKIDEYWAERSHGAASITLNFFTEATCVSFDYKLFTKTNILSTVEVYQDGFLTHSVKTDDLSESGTLSFDLKTGNKEVEIYLSNYNEYGIGNFKINGAYKVKPTGRNKVLFIGDSITQGGGTRSSGQTYVNFIKRTLGYEVVNQGVASYLYDENIIQNINFKPKKIVVAFGTNNLCKTDEVNETLITAFYKRLNEFYPDLPVLVILPTYRNDGDKEELRKRFSVMTDTIRKECKKYKNVKVVNGYEMIPHFPEFFLEDFVHPNRYGAKVYEENLIREIENAKF